MGATDQLLEGRIAWITGAASGIGRAVAFRLAASGATVAGLDINDIRLKEVFGEAGWPAVTVDVRDEAAVALAYNRLLERAGPPDILVNSAGIASSASMSEHDTALWRDVLATNLTGSFLLTRLVFAGMCEREFGRIVNLSSGSGFRVGAGNAAYGASKAGVVALTKSTAAEGAPYGVTANAVAPGLVDTPMMRALLPSDEEMAQAARDSAISNPIGRPLLPEEIAHVVWFLSLPDSGSITGQTIHVNNGSLML